MPYVSVSNDWTEKDGIWFSGTIAYEDRVVGGIEACNLFDDVHTVPQFRDIISESTGFFAVIISREKRLLFAVDQVGSREIFYSVNDDDVYISDRTQWIQNQLQGSESPPEIIKKELLNAGYITQDDTLYPRIKKTQPAQIVTIEFESGSPDRKITNYFNLAAKNKIEDPDDLFEELENTIESSFERLLSFAGDSPILLSLSGGYDSRLLAHMLHRYGVKNVYAFTHDLQGEEFEEAREVAEALDLDWFKLTYTHEELREAYQSGAWEPVEEHVEGFRAPIPELNTVLMLKRLKEDDRLPDTGVILRGHTIAEAGKRIPTDFLDKEVVNSKEVITDIISRHYTNTRRNSDTVPDGELSDRISSWLDTDAELTQEIAIEKCEEWYWRYRIHHYLMCDPSLFSYFGYDFWHLFLDKEYLEFYGKIPIKHRYKRKLLESYTDELDKKANIRIDNEESVDISRKLKQLVVGSPLELPAKKNPTNI